MDVTLLHVLVLSGIIFTLGIMGIFLNRRNVIVLLMSIELILLAANIAFVAFARFMHNIDGEIFTLFILAVAAAEASIGLAILVAFFRVNKTIEVDAMKELKG